MKINFDILASELSAAGMHPVRVKEMVKQIRQDMIDWPEAYEDADNRREMLSHGFIPGRKQLFGADFNPDTYDNYYSDYDYFMAHPLNNHFAFWINDKLTLKYMLNHGELSKLVPEYYLYIENDGRYSYLMDSPESVEKGDNYLFDLLVEKKHLAMKPNHGAGGMGFLGVHYEDGQIIINSKPVTREEFEAMKPSLNGYIVTEFIKQSKEMDKVFNEADCALRIILYKLPQENPTAAPEYDCLISFARFGAKISEGASNLSRGGLAVQIDWNTGEYIGGFRGNAKYWGEEGAIGFTKHPDTGVVIEGTIVPHWDVIKKGLLDVCNYLSSLDFFGMDVIVTEDGFQLCEINSAPSTGLGQFHYGKCCLDNENARKFVNSKKRPAKKSFLEVFEAAIEK